MSKQLKFGDQSKGHTSVSNVHRQTSVWLWWVCENNGQNFRETFQKSLVANRIVFNCNALLPRGKRKPWPKISVSISLYMIFLFSINDFSICFKSTHCGTNKGNVLSNLATGVYIQWDVPEYWQTVCINFKTNSHRGLNESYCCSNVQHFEMYVSLLLTAVCSADSWMSWVLHSWLVPVRQTLKPVLLCTKPQRPQYNA